MKIIVISDIHGDYKSLSFLDCEKFDKLIILGDLFGIDDEDNSKIAMFLKKYYSKLTCLLGNCDSKYLYEHYNLAVNDEYIKINYLNKNIYFTHGHKYNMNKLSFYGKNNILIYGHEHIPYIENTDNMVYICVGSISKPRSNYDRSYALIEDNYLYLIGENKIIESKKID